MTTKWLRILRIADGDGSRGHFEVPYVSSLNAENTLHVNPKISSNHRQVSESLWRLRGCGGDAVGRGGEVSLEPPHGEGRHLLKRA